MKKLNLLYKTLLLTTLPIATSVFSANFCVSTTAELNDALLTASINDQDDIIKIESGTYTVDTTGFFSNGFQYLGENENHDLEISGGWEAFFISCGIQFSDPTLTKLDGDELKRVLFAKVGSERDITISNLQISNGFLTGAVSRGLNNGGGLRIELGGGTANLDRLFFINNNAFGAGGLLVIDDGRVYLKNSLFVANNTESGGSVVNIQINENYVINNTIMFNSGGLYTHTDNSKQTYIANNLLWGNDVHDLRLTRTGNGEVFLYNNNIDVESGHGATTESANISQVPEFETGLLNFTPVWGSALINSGKKSPTIVPIPITFEFAWNYGLVDYNGDTRLQNGHVDIGAFEAPTPPDLIFENGFE